MPNIIEAKDALSYMEHISSFRNDPRCYPVYYITEDTEDDAWKTTTIIFQTQQPLIDYDVAYSFEKDIWVGVVVRDHEQIA